MDIWIRLEFLFLYFLFVGQTIIFVRHLKSNVKMHEAHARMINILIDNLIDNREKELTEEMKQYFERNKITRH